MMIKIKSKFVYGVDKKPKPSPISPPLQKKKQMTNGVQIVRVVRAIDNLSTNIGHEMKIISINRITGSLLFNASVEVLSDNVHSDDIRKKVPAIINIFVVKSDIEGKCNLSLIINPNKCKLKRKKKWKKNAKKTKITKRKVQTKDGKIKKTPGTQNFSKLIGTKNLNDVLFLFMKEVCLELIKFPDQSSKAEYLKGLQEKTNLFVEYRTKAMMNTKVRSYYDVIFGSPSRIFKIILTKAQKEHKSQPKLINGSPNPIFNFLQKLGKTDGNTPIFSSKVIHISKELNAFITYGQRIMMQALKKLHEENKSTLQQNNLLLLCF